MTMSTALRRLVLSAALAMALSLAAAADAPPARRPEKVPPEPPPAESPTGPSARAGQTGQTAQPKTALQQLVQQLLTPAALSEARKAAERPGATREDRELLAALYLLAGQPDDARRVAVELFGAGGAPGGSGSAAALAAAFSRLDAEVRRQPARRKGERHTREEAEARLRLALVALALDPPRVREAYEAIVPLGPTEPAEASGPGPVPATSAGRDDVQTRTEMTRLALLGLASWSSGGEEEKKEALRHFEDLARRAAAGTRLALRATTLVDSIQGYGVYTERRRNACRPGEKLMAYCEVLNFDCRQLETGGWLTALDVDLSVEEEVGQPDKPAEEPKGGSAPPPAKASSSSAAAPAAAPAPTAGRRPAWRRTDQVRYRTRSEIRDLHLRIDLDDVPARLVPGHTYWLRIAVRDAATGKSETSRELKLEAVR